MLHNVPKGINRLARNVIINHPNTYNGYCVIKKFEQKPETFGSVGILSVEESDDYTFELLGECFAMQVFDGGFSNSGMNDAVNGNIQPIDEYRFIIEPEHEEGHELHFSLKIGDILMLILGSDTSNAYQPAYEIVDIETVNNIPPFSVRYVTNRRSDLDITKVNGVLVG